MTVKAFKVSYTVDGGFPSYETVWAASELDARNVFMYGAGNTFHGKPSKLTISELVTPLKV